jgi:probable O-glycosylation ligase (exosortase A-associated)
MKGLIFVYAVTYGGSLVALIRPYIGLLIYVGFSICKPEYAWSDIEPGNYLNRTVAIAFLIGWALQGFGGFQVGRAWPIVLAITGYFLWSCLSALQAFNQDVAWPYVEDLLKIVLPFVVGVTLINSVAQLKQLAWVIVISAGYVALHEHEQYYTWGLQETDNSIAHAMVVGTGVAFFLALYSEKWWQKLAAFLALMLMVHTVFFHMSRGAMLGLLVTGAFSFLVMEKKPRHYVALVIALLIALRLAGPSVQERFWTMFASKENRDWSAESRFELWSAMWGVARENPAFGVGPNHWQLIAHEHGFNRGKDGHGLWAQLSAELGLPGVALLLATYCLVMFQLWPLCRQRGDTSDPWFGHVARMVMASVLGYMAESMFGSFKHLEIQFYVAMLGAGAIKLYYQQRPAAQYQLQGRAVAQIPRPGPLAGGMMPAGS